MCPGLLAGQTIFSSTQVRQGFIRILLDETMHSVKIHQGKVTYLLGTMKYPKNRSGRINKFLLPNEI